MTTTLTNYNLQELLRKTSLNKCIENVVLDFSSEYMSVTAAGKELRPKDAPDPGNPIDNSLFLRISYPAISSKNYSIGIPSIKELISLLEIFDREEPLRIVCDDREMTISDLNGQSSIVYDLIRPQTVTTQPRASSVDFNHPPRLIIADRSKPLAFTAKMMIDAQLLKDNVSKISKLDTTEIKVDVKNSIFGLGVRSGRYRATRSFTSKTDVSGEGHGTYSHELLTAINLGIGTASISLANDYPLHLSYRHNNIKVDYLFSPFVAIS